MKLSMEDILLMSALEKVTGVSAKDCIAKDNVISYLVKEADVGKAIGKGAVNVKDLEAKLKKRIEIVGYYPEPEKLVAASLEVKYNSAQVKGSKLVLAMDGQEKRKALSNMGRFKRVKEFVERNYKLDLILN
ncbi:MAG: NusA-like transcription termination signal-binding factor [archaeon]